PAAVTTASASSRLMRLADGPVCGVALAREDVQTRAAVWKRIQGLRRAGVATEAWPGRGYALAAPLDLLDAARIRTALPPAVAAGIDARAVAWCLESTNSERLGRAAGAGVPVLRAER